MKKSDLEILSLALLTAACGSDQDGQAEKSKSVSQATAPAAPSEPVKSAAGKPGKMVRSSLPTAEFNRAGRTGGRTNEMPGHAYGRTGRGGGKSEP